MEPTLATITFTEDIFLLPKLVTIIVKKPWIEVAPEERTQLSKILGALRLSLEKVRIVTQEELALSNLIGNPTHVIVFGLEIKGVSLFEFMTINGVKVVLSEDLSILLKNEESKKKLWLSLKSMFEL